MKTSKDKWETQVRKESSSTNIDDLTWISPEGIKIAPLYTKDDLETLSDLNSIPGEAPFIRGPRSTMYVGRPWTIRQYA